MNMNSKISIIIPVHNSEKYLSNCVESLLVQSYGNLEIILINDGSTDGSPKICDEFARIDQRVLVVHKKNEGSSSARNEGLKLASGEFIGFVDSDDYVLPTMYEKLLSLITEFNLELVFCDFNSASGAITKTRTQFDGALLSADEYIRSMKFHPHGVFNVWNKLFISHLAKSTEFIHGKIHQDALYMSEILGKTNQIGHVQETLYIYNDLNASVTRSKFSENKIDGIEVVIKAHSNLVKVSKTKMSQDAIRKWYLQWLIGRYALLSLNRGSTKWQRVKGLVKSEIKENYISKPKDLRIELINNLPSRIFGIFYSAYMKIVKYGMIKSI